MKLALKISAVIYLIVTALLFTAQINYNRAKRAAFNSEGTDAAIETAMMLYGFNIDALDNRKPSWSEKVRALFTAGEDDMMHRDEYKIELLTPEGLIKLTDNRDGSTAILHIDELEETINKGEE